MWRPANSPGTDDAHVRQLLDQRFSRADPFGCYSSSAVSEASDTPSVYSRAFSPRPAVHADLLTDNYPHKSPTSHRPFHLYDDPSSSVLDLSEDSHSSMALHEPYDRDDGIDDNEKTLEVDEDEDYLPRGPKMRFHSRAPWELEGGSLEDVKESESSGSATLMAMLTGGRSKGSKADPSSPRPSTSAGRPSLESSRSILNSKRSFDTSSLSHPRGALYALAQESISSTSLGQANFPGRQDRLRGKYPQSRFQSRSPVDASFPGQSVLQLPTDNHSFVLPSSPPRPSGEITSSALDVPADLNARYSQCQSNDDSFHPYANPDLVNSYTTDTHSEYPKQSFIQHPGVSRNDSLMIATENSPILSKLAPPPIQGVPPVPSPKRRMSHIHGRDISSPVPIRSASLGPDSPSQLQGDSRPEPVPPMLNAIPGWSERPVNPGFSLISLEEARAQRPRLAPAQAPSSLDSPPSSGGSSTVTSLQHVDHDAPTVNAFAVSDTLYISGGDSRSVDRRSRARSISAGAKAMNALQSIVKQPERKDTESGPVTGPTHTKDTGSVSGGKNLKHKKSGFLRLFGNGGKEERPPPVPTVPPQLSTTPTNSILPEGLKSSSRRVPVPNISPSLLDTMTQHDGGGTSGFGRSSSRRLAPSLSINTASSSSTVSPPPRGSSITASSSQVTIPQSAPAHASDFPTLKLRPVSSLFSAHFADHIDVTKLNFDDFDGTGPKTTSKIVLEKHQEHPRQNSLASGSVSSVPSSGSGTSFIDSQYVISTIASPTTSTPLTALTTPTTPGAISPLGTWYRDQDRGGGRENTDQNSARTSSSHASSSVVASTPHIVIDSEASTVKILQEHLDSTNKMWQKRVWELERQITQLKNEVADLKKSETNEKVKPLIQPPRQHQTSVENVRGIMNRPRARTGGSSRFVNGQL